MKVEVDVPTSPYDLCGRTASWKKKKKKEKKTKKKMMMKKKKTASSELRSCDKVGVDVLGSPVPNSPYGLCGRKATQKKKKMMMTMKKKK